MTDRTESGLDAFDSAQRLAALRGHLDHAAPAPTPAGNVNMHMHSFFSFNPAGNSPTHLAWQARQAGLYAAGLCDFDVLDGLEEFLRAGRMLALRAAVHLETRAFLREFATVEITSPGEPGVTYIMGAGFATVPPAGSPAARTLADLRSGARARNEALIRRINAQLPDIAVQYEEDVLPLTPAGSATERHIVRAYLGQSRARFSPDRFAAFWAGILHASSAEVRRWSAEGAPLEEQIRARLVKRGGLGYEPPSPKTFPPVDDFIAWVLSCHAVPMITWLDGTSEGENDPAAMLQCMTAKGAAALNIIPDRNWNIRDPDTRSRKVAKLREVVRTAGDFRIPINIGTELNKDGQPFCDDLAGEVLREFQPAFLYGAQVLVGHTLLLRYAGFSYTGKAADAEFGADRAARNACFASVGRLPPLTETQDTELRARGEAGSFSVLRDSGAAGQWRIG